MKIQLDTVNKTIKIEEDINLREFITKMKVLLGKEYEEYILLPETITYWTNPIYPNPLYPTISYVTNTGNYTADNTGIFNISM